MSKLTVACYVQVSSKNEDLIDVQKRIAIEDAKLFEYEPKFYIESGRETTLKEMAKDIADGDIAAVWIATLDRLSRSTDTQQDVIEALRRHNVKLFVRRKEYDLDDPRSRFLLGLHGAASTFQKKKATT
ncbi:MAG TPA: recombinase family protein [Spirochaetia bacterium]|nr:recombinase family protein [Spirochaetia bacterium]